MPLVEHIQLPTFERLRESGQEVLSLATALKQDIRELHIGLLNMMPDAALQVTEQQFMRMVGSSNQIAQIYVHPFSVPGLPRSPETQAYIDEYYTTFEQLREEGLDALILTGANVSNPRPGDGAILGAAHEVMEWAAEHVTSVLCSCLATHSLMKYRYDIDRQLLPKKKWGVYSYRVAKPSIHCCGTSTRALTSPTHATTPLPMTQFESAGLTILIDSPEDGVHMAVSPDQFRNIYLQGHPEYHINSLLKEYKREVMPLSERRARRAPLPGELLFAGG